MKKLIRYLFLFVALILASAEAQAGAFSLVKSAPVQSAGVSSNTPIVNVAQQYTVQQVGGNVTATAANQFSFAGAPAVSIAQAALGVGAAGASLFAAPALGTIIGLMSVGQAGYTLYQAVKAAGITINPDGSAGNNMMPTYWINGNNGSHYATLDAVCKAVVSTSSAGVSFGTYGWCQWNGNPQYFSENSSGVYNAPTAATNADVTNAISIAEQNAIASADAWSLAQARGVNPAQYLPSSTANRNTTATTVTAQDGTVVTITPPTTYGGTETVSPAPASITGAPATSDIPAPSSWPTDYSRQGEAATAANTVTTALSPINTGIAAMLAPMVSIQGSSTASASGVASIQASNIAIQNSVASMVVSTASTASNVAGTIPILKSIEQSLSVSAVQADPAAIDQTTMPGYGSASPDLVNTFTTLKAFTPSGVGTCPEPTIDLSSVHMGVLTLSAQCTIANSLANVIAPIMELVFTIMALLIVMSA